MWASKKDVKIAGLEARRAELGARVARRARGLLREALVSLMYPVAMWAIDSILSPGSGMGLPSVPPLALLLLGPVHFSRDREPVTVSEAVEQGVSRALHPVVGIFMPFVVLALVVAVDFEVLRRIAWYPAGILAVLLLAYPVFSLLVLTVQGLRLSVMSARLGYMRRMRR